MCDMRGNPTICRNKDGLIFDLKMCKTGGINIKETQWLEPGIYHVGASGCGYYHYDGEEIYRLDSDYRYKLNTNSYYGYDYIYDEWQNSKYIYGVKSGEVNLWGKDAVNYNTIEWNKIFKQGIKLI